MNDPMVRAREGLRHAFAELNVPADFLLPLEDFESFIWRFRSDDIGVAEVPREDEVSPRILARGVFVCIWIGLLGDVDEGGANTPSRSACFRRSSAS